MSYPVELERWIDELSNAFPVFSRPQVRGLGLYSYGMMLLCHSGLTQVSAFLAALLGMKWEAVRRRLREWTYEAAAKRGPQRREIALEAQFAPLLKWILSKWQCSSRLILALDVTYLRQRHTILMVSVVYGGCALPVAWTVMRGETKGAWHPLWVKLLACLAPALSPGWQVWVLCDEGLYSKRLFQHICQAGWHPLMRIRTQGLYRRQGRRAWRSLEQVAQRGMKAKAFRGQCFKGDPLVCSLWVQWASGYEQPCLLVTDIAPKHLKRHVYGLRHWIECGFKDLKRGGLHWEQSKMSCPQRMARLVFVMAVAMVGLVGQGAIHADEPDPLDNVPLSPMRRGWIRHLVAAVRQQPTQCAVWPPYYLPPLPI